MQIRAVVFLRTNEVTFLQHCTRATEEGEEMASGDYREARKKGAEETVRRWQKVIHVFRRFFSTIDFQICPLDAP